MTDAKLAVIERHARAAIEHSSGADPGDVLTLIAEVRELQVTLSDAIGALQLAKEIIREHMDEHHLYPSVGNFVFIEETLNKLKREAGRGGGENERDQA